MRPHSMLGATGSYPLRFAPSQTPQRIAPTASLRAAALYVSQKQRSLPAAAAFFPEGGAGGD
jgi:hypothetical protein